MDCNVITSRNVEMNPYFNVVRLSQAFYQRMGTITSREREPFFITALGYSQAVSFAALEKSEHPGMMGIAHVKVGVCRASLCVRPMAMRGCLLARKMKGFSA